MNLHHMFSGYVFTGAFIMVRRSAIFNFNKVFIMRLVWKANSTEMQLQNGLRCFLETIDRMLNFPMPDGQKHICVNTHRLLITKGKLFADM